MAQLSRRAMDRMATASPWVFLVSDLRRFGIMSYAIARMKPITLDPLQVRFVRCKHCVLASCPATASLPCCAERASKGGQYSPFMQPILRLTNACVCSLPDSQRVWGAFESCRDNSYNGQSSLQFACIVSEAACS